MIHSYFNQITDLLETVEKEEKKAMTAAAEKVSDAIQQGGIIHLFGCGHSHILTEEVYYRAGGLVPIHPIFHEPLMLHEGAVRSSDLERKNEYAKSFMEEQDIRQEDIVIILSTSGRNPVPVDAAEIAKSKGAYVIGVTSIAYASSQPSRHESGKYLYDAVDLVIDNHAPIGDALLSHERVKIKFSPSSTVIGAAILNAIFAESIRQMAENDCEPPIFLSGNLEGSDDHNQMLIERYKERVKL
ncbi:SIS domain-containing protein [Oceanobacillus sp. CFH 90083]|uniref:SIS domain-containing protein n=1 Tax=Oceanobacillus sp. CFH 90083 TaxID=2592336 RepID=UPI00128BFC55|nr:SIS domain-containing protein [Oceanobacillus sp. CFH 90083]